MQHLVGYPISSATHQHSANNSLSKLDCLCMCIDVSDKNNCYGEGIVWILKRTNRLQQKHLLVYITKLYKTKVY